MASGPKFSKKLYSSLTLASIADAACWYCVLVLVVLVLFSSVKETRNRALDYDDQLEVVGRRILDRPCDEIYVVQEGETLHSISDKCGDPFIVEKNPHIHDPDDVFPGFVIKITPSKIR